MKDCEQLGLPQSLRLIDERPLFGLSEHFPLCSKTLGYLRVVHLWVLLRHLPPLPSRPNHEGVHGPLDVVGRLGASSHNSGSSLLHMLILWMVDDRVMVMVVMVRSAKRPQGSHHGPSLLCLSEI